jgi:hypothetical protein
MMEFKIAELKDLAHGQVDLFEKGRQLAEPMILDVVDAINEVVEMPGFLNLQPCLNEGYDWIVYAAVNEFPSDNHAIMKIRLGDRAGRHYL